MKRLVRRIEGHILHSAGLPRFTSNFSRDRLLAALMSDDLELLREQVAFSAHFQNARDLWAAGYLLGDNDLVKQADLMVEAGLHSLWEGASGFVIARDRQGDIAGYSSDSLHVPAYLPRGSRWFDRTRRVVPFLETAPEYLVCAGDGRVRKEGCDPQLWTLAAKSYFGLPPSSGRGFLEAL